MGDRAGISVFLKTADGPWQSLGREIARGVFPEGVSLSTNEGGPDTASFSLRRKASTPWPDLAAFNQVEIHVGGLPVWGGRIWEAPLSDTGEDVISVQARGWQYHLDDDMLDRFYVHTAIGDWRDMRTAPTMNLAVQVANGVVSGPAFGWAKDAEIVTATGVGITLDLGPNRTAKRIVVHFDTVNPDSFATIYARTHNTSDAHSGSTNDAFATTFGTIASPVSGTFATARRYVSLFMYRSDGLTSVAGSDFIFRPSKIQVFAATAYESGNASILKASQVATDVLSSGALPLLDDSTELIETKTFSIPDLAPSGYQTPRSILTAANAYEGDLVGVDLNRKLFFRERATVPVVEIGAWPGSQFSDSSTNSAEALYNRVIVQGTGPDGGPISEVRTATSSLLTRQGFTRTATLSVSAPMTTASAQAIGDVWLAEKSSPKFKGTATIAGHGAARSINGGGIHPSELLLRGGDLLRVGHLIEPRTGAIGRDGVIKSISYSHDTETATVELDNERGRFEALMERLAVVTTQAVR